MIPHHRAQPVLYCKIDHTRTVRATIHQITNQNHPVLGARIYLPNQGLQLTEATVNVANYNKTAVCPRKR